MRIPFNDGWAVRTPQGPFAAFDAAAVEPTPVTLPHDALRDAQRTPDAPAAGANAYYPPGNHTYLKTFDVPAAWEGRVVRLEFGGAMRHAQVFINEEFAGNWADGYARFFVDATPFLRYGEPNKVRVETRTGQDSRWYSGAGLHRGVFCHVDAPAHVLPDGVRVTTLRLENLPAGAGDAPPRATVEVATELTNAGLTTASTTLTTVLVDPHGVEVDRDATPVTLPPGRPQRVRQRFVVTDPALWGPESPQLYTADTTLTPASGGEGATRTTTFGIRTVTADPGLGLRINGEPVLLRGACIHHDNGPLGGAAIPRAEERRIELLRAAGFNAVRAAHNPLSAAMLDACDRLGMLVMDEAFDMWVRFKTPYDHAMEFPQWWRADLASMVAKDLNHPSVIMYSLGNEIAEVGMPHGAVLAREMAEHVRALDPTRLVTNGVNAALTVLDELAEQAKNTPGGLNELMAGAASDPGDGMNALGSGENVTRRTAESSAALDVLGLNYAEGRYALDAEKFPHHVLVGSETFPQRIGDLWPMVLEHPHVIGDFTWTGWDYLGEVGIGATAYADDPDATPALEREYPFLTAWCGDLDITGWRRPVSFYREIVFGLRTEPSIAVLRPEHHGREIAMASPWSWSDSVSSWTWPGFEGRPVVVEVYADADEVALLCNGAEVARGPVGEVRPMQATLETTYTPGTLTAVAYRGGEEVGRTELVTAGEAVLTASADRTTLRADGTDLAYVALEWRDADGILATAADAEVTVEVSGAGVLAGMCSANPKTAERFDADTWRTFDGRALAVVRPTGPGPITVTVRTGSAEPLTLDLEATDD
ncbi:glycoside hydrolase family 2 TIM barrel-domain containing protein [Propioniciclava soli]|uniref:glycoside hydrolase family 2 TIM barrel-domain containing protein n=1 Tax=Propioniciclava soli TaxID=2775081 RepID=UPI001E405B50|nr:glycoside hydrolase family 2 TIM barrel-domain containing protein [Propioniciclava soli]